MIKTIKEWRGLNANTIWINNCMKRDGNRCVLSGATADLVVHHITHISKLVYDYDNSLDQYKPLFEAKFWDLSNGVTISADIHKLYHSKHIRRAFKNNEDNWEEFCKEWKEENISRREYNVKEYWLKEDADGEDCLPLLITEVS